MLSIKDFLKQFPFIYPGKIIASCREWIDKENFKIGIYAGVRNNTYQLIEPVENHTHQLPKLIRDSDSQKFSVNIFYHTTPSYLFYLKDCYIYKQLGLVLNRRNLLFQEFTHHFAIESLSRFILKHPFYTFSSQIKKVDGIGAMLTSPQSHNYYHWLFDVLPRIKLYETVLDHIDHFCISSAVPQKFLDVLPQFGIPLNKILQVNNIEKIHFDNLYVASLPGSEGRSPQWAINYVREKLINPSDKLVVDKKIYFKRGIKVDRGILNEDNLIELLQINGFEIIDPDTLSIQQQILLMQQTKLVISAHGAALSNLLFANKDITVIEIFSPDYFRTDCFFTLSSILKLKYHYLQGKKPANARWGDIEVDITDLEKLVNNLAH